MLILLGFLDLRGLRALLALLDLLGLLASHCLPPWLLLGLLTGLLVLLGFLDLRGLRALLTLLDLLGLLASLCLPPSRFASALRFDVTCLLALLAPSAICLRASPFTLLACFALFAVLFAY